MAEWTVFKMTASMGKLVLTEIATVDGFGQDDAIISACESNGSAGKFAAFPADELSGREVELWHHVRFVD